MFGQLVGRGPNGPERDLKLVDLWEAIDPRWLATRRPELVVQTPRDLPILLHSFQSSTQLALLGCSRVLLQSSVGG